MCLQLLIVDDNKDSADMLSILLRGAGYANDTANSGEEALAMAHKRNYDFAILDYRMPRMNGVELLEKLHETQPKMNAVLLTGFPSINIVYPAIREGALRVFQKPMPFEELLPVLQTRAFHHDLGELDDGEFGGEG